MGPPYASLRRLAEQERDRTLRALAAAQEALAEEQRGLGALEAERARLAGMDPRLLVAAGRYLTLLGDRHLAARRRRGQALAALAAAELAVIEGKAAAKRLELLEAAARAAAARRQAVAVQADLDEAALVRHRSRRGG